MKKMTLLMLFTVTTNLSYAQFWKKAINVVTNPVGWATGEAAKKITGNQKIANLINPTPVVIDNTVASVSRTKSLIQDAIRQGDWYSLNIYTSPLFVQILSAAKSVLGNFKMLTVKDLTYKNAFFCVRRIRLCLLPF